MPHSLDTLLELERELLSFLKVSDFSAGQRILREAYTLALEAAEREIENMIKENTLKSRYRDGETAFDIVKDIKHMLHYSTLSSLNPLNTKT